MKKLLLAAAAALALTTPSLARPEPGAPPTGKVTMTRAEQIKQEAEAAQWRQEMQERLRREEEEAAAKAKAAAEERARAAEERAKADAAARAAAAAARQEAAKRDAESAAAAASSAPAEEAPVPMSPPGTFKITPRPATSTASKTDVPILQGAPPPFVPYDDAERGVAVIMVYMTHCGTDVPRRTLEGVMATVYNGKGGALRAQYDLENSLRNWDDAKWASWCSEMKPRVSR